MKFADFNRKDSVRHFRYYVYIEALFDTAKLVINFKLQK